MSSVNVEHDEIIYPSSDGQPMAETSEHLLLMVALISALRHHFKQHRKVYVIGNMFLYYEKGNPAARRAPDIMVVKGVDPSLQRRSFKTWLGGESNAVDDYRVNVIGNGPGRPGNQVSPLPNAWHPRVFSI
jgi:hypothetical protein